MPTLTPVIPSGSTNGRPIKVAATATPGTLIHTATSTSGQFDELTLYAMNTDSSDRKLTIELGGVTDPDDLIERTIPAESGLVPILVGHRLNGGVAVRAFAASADVVTIVPDVTRYTP